MGQALRRRVLSDRQGGLVLVRASIFRANAGQRIVAFDASRSPPNPMQRNAARARNGESRHARRCNLHTCQVIPTVVAQRRGPRLRRPEDRSGAKWPATPVGQSLLGIVGPPDKTTAISRMPRSKRSARRRSRAARRAAARPRWAIRTCARTAQPRPYRTDTISRNARRTRRMDSRHLRAPVRHDAVGDVRSTSASTRTRHSACAREAPATRRSQSLRSPRSRTSALRTRGRRRT